MQKSWFIACVVLVVCILPIRGQNVDSLFARTVATEQLVDSTDDQRFAYCFFEGARYLHRMIPDSALLCFDRCATIDPENAAIYYNKSLAYQMTKEYNHAFACVCKMVELQPDNTEYQEMLISWLVAQYRFDEAIAGYRKLLRQKPTSQYYLNALLELYQITKQLKPQLEVLQRLEELNGVDEENSFRQMAVLHALNRPKNIEKQIQKLIRKFPSKTEHVVMLGDFYLSAGKEKKALQCYDSQYAKDSTDGTVLSAYANYYSFKGNEALADEYMLRALNDKRYSINNKMLWLRSHVATLLQAHDTVHADSILYTLETMYPDEEVLLTLLYDYARVKRDTVACQHYLQQLLNQNPRDEEKWLQLLSLNENDPVRMAAIVDEALLVFPTSSRWYYYKASLLYDDERYLEAIAVLDVLLNNNQTDKTTRAQLLTMKGDLMQHLKRYKTAVDCYEEVLRIAPDDISVKNNYAYLLACCGIDLAKAETLSSAAVKAEPNSATFLDTYAWVLFMRGEYKLARFYQERAIAAAERLSDELLEHYGDILAQLGEIDLAIELWNEALELNPQLQRLHDKIEMRQYIPYLLPFEDENEELHEDVQK
ncbi:MAG: tetratricopeptide repeat protein [Paludibacteraceae bacterium]